MSGTGKQPRDTGDRFAQVASGEPQVDLGGLGQAGPPKRVPLMFRTGRKPPPVPRATPRP